VVSIPVHEVPESEAEPPVPVEKKEPAKVVAKKDSDKRPIQVRYRWEWLKSLVKLVVLAAIAYGGYMGYQYYQKQSKKDLGTLLREYGEGKMGNDMLIKQKAGAEEFETLADYSRSSQKEVRELVAECLGQLKLKGFEILERLLIKDKESSVRQAAAKALGNVRSKRCVELLITHLAREKDVDVRSEIGFSLRQLTGQNPATGKHEFWEMWWKDNKSGFKISE
jgi:hypothetical protein